MAKVASIKLTDDNIDHNTLNAYDDRLAWEACQRWLGITSRPERNRVRDHMISFASFLGHPFKPDKHKRYVPIHYREIRDLIDKINGPHGDAILKVLEIRNAEKAETGSGS